MTTKFILLSHLGNELILIFIFGFLIIGLIIGCLSAFIEYIRKSSKGIKISCTDYWNVIWVSSLIGMLTTGIVCGSGL